MSRVTGTYRGAILEHALSETKNGYPQFVARITATQVYDENEQEWIDLAGTDEIADMAYLVLCTNTQDIFHLANLREALGWTGGTFKSLQEGDWVGVVVQYRVEPNEYNGSVTQQVKWVRGGDAPVGGACRSASDETVKDMERKFGGFLKQSATSASPKPPPVPKPPKTKSSAKPTKKASPKPPTAEAPTTGPDLRTLPVRTEEECWDVIRQAADISEESDSNVEQYWFDAKAQHGNDWEAIKTAVLSELIPF